MIYVLDGWDRYLDYKFWWLHAMTLVWVMFTLILYVLEPLVLHKLFKEYAEKDPSKTFAFMHKAHWFLLLLSLLTTAGAVAGSHGWFFITGQNSIGSGAFAQLGQFIKRYQFFTFEVKEFNN